MQFLGACTKKNPYMLVTELMYGGSLADCFKLAEFKTRPVSPKGPSPPLPFPSPLPFAMPFRALSAPWVSFLSPAAWLLLFGR